MVLAKKWTMFILYVELIIFSYIGFLIWKIAPVSTYEVISKTFSIAFAAGGIGASLFGIRMLYYHSFTHG